MATIDKQGRVHGKAGPLVYRTIGEINVVQSRPRRFKQTQATRESGIEFGLASNTARIMREALWPVFYSPDKGMVNRFTSRILKCIRGSQTKGRGERDLHDGDLSYLAGFQFNKNSSLQQALQVRPEVQVAADGRPEVRVPSFNSDHDIRCPMNRYSGITLRLTATAFHFRAGYYEHLASRDVWVDYGATMPGQVWKVEKELPAGSIVLVTVSLIMSMNKTFSDQTLNTKDWSPAEILYAVQVPQGEEEVQKPEFTYTGDPYEKKPLNAYRGEATLSLIQRIREKVQKAEVKKDAALYEKVEKLRQQILQESPPSGPPALPEGKILF